MAISGGGESPPLPPPSTEDSFRRLLVAQGKKLSPSTPPNFVKKLDLISEIELPLDYPMKVVVSLFYWGSVRQFM